MHPCQQVGYGGASVNTGMKDVQVIGTDGSVVGKIMVGLPIDNLQLKSMVFAGLACGVYGR